MLLLQSLFHLLHLNFEINYAHQLHLYQVQSTDTLRLDFFNVVYFIVFASYH